jgi:hypothetical protein
VWRSTSWHDQFDFPAVTLMLLASFVIIYFILRVLPGRVRLVHRVLGQGGIEALKVLRGADGGER